MVGKVVGRLLVAVDGDLDDPLVPLGNLILRVLPRNAEGEGVLESGAP